MTKEQMNSLKLGDMVAANWEDFVRIGTMEHMKGVVGFISARIEGDNEWIITTLNLPNEHVRSQYTIHSFSARYWNIKT